MTCYWSQISLLQIFIYRYPCHPFTDERLTNAIAKARTFADGKEVDEVCGSPVTAGQAAVLGGTVTFTCNPPLGAYEVIITIPFDGAFLQLCEVKVWEVPLDECPAAPGTLTLKKSRLIYKMKCDSNDTVRHNS